MKLEVREVSIHSLHVKVPDNLREKFETTMQDYLTRPMRLKDGITIDAESFVSDVEFEDRELVEFHMAVMEADTSVEPDGYLFH